MALISKSPNLNITQNLTETYPTFVELDQSGQYNHSKEMAPNGKASKSILETIIACLQNCLKQKDEALAEYRQMMDEMRQSYTSQIVAASNGSNRSKESLDESRIQTSANNQRQPSEELETLYQELFLKPCNQQNEELLGLLQKTFTELNQ